jgi:regulator of sigma E protease
MGLLVTLAAFICALAILIVFHELGHYAVARLCGVKILRFSVGFGKPLFTRRLGADRTEWMLAAIPLGGYVKMLDEREGDVAPEERSRAFNRQPVWQRMAIVAAGPLANLLLAIIFYTILLMAGIHGLKPINADVTPGSAAAAAHFAPHDQIIRINGHATPSWQDVEWILLKQATQKNRVGVTVRDAGGQTQDLSLDTRQLPEVEADTDILKLVGLTPQLPVSANRVGALLPNGPAARAGLQAHDLIAHVNDVPVTSWQQLVDIIKAHPDQPLRLDVRRNGRPLTVTVTPEVVHENNKTFGRIGASPEIDPAQVRQLAVVIQRGPVDAIVQATAKTFDTAWFSVKMMGRLVTGQASSKNLSGPISIADYAGQSAKMGLLPYINFLALISISIGILNLLPIPVLDGGHLMYYIVEAVQGRPVSEKLMARGQQIGLTLLLALMVFAFYNDINRLLTGQ